MKHRQAAMHIMTAIKEIEKSCGDLMMNLGTCKRKGELSEDEASLVTDILLFTLGEFHSKLVPEVIKHHPDLTPVCKECSEPNHFEVENPEDKS